MWDRLSRMNARVTILGKCIKSIVGIYKAALIIIVRMGEAFDESYPPNTPKRGKTLRWNFDLTKQRRTTTVLINRAATSDSTVPKDRYK